LKVPKIDIEADVELSSQGLTLNNVVVDKSSIEIIEITVAVCQIVF
jgi:hypothetical protein